MTTHRGTEALRRRVVGLAVALCAAWVAILDAQQLLDRVVARVGGTAITETDVRAALALGLVEARPGEDPIASGTRQLIDRRLLLAEVARFPPSAPPESEIDALVATMRAHAGNEYEALLRRTGLDEPRVRELARDTLRIEAYIDQRFGRMQVSLQEAREYYDAHRDAFTRGGTTRPFEEVETEARAAASAERRQTLLAEWLADLRVRADVVEVTSRPEPRAAPRGN